MIGTEVETHYLEFKGLESHFSTRPEKELLAKGLSGFANADGGVIVWGVDCRQGSDGKDVPRKIIPIDGLTHTLGKLEELRAFAVSPAVPGIEHRLIPSDGTSDSGVLATFVPRSDEGPHMARFRLDRYYVRVGSTFRKMEHFQLEDMFGRRPRPVLECGYSLQVRSENPGAGRARRSRILAVLTLRNVGRGSAERPFVGIRDYAVRQTGGGLPRGMLVAFRSEAGDTSFLAPDLTLHPGTSVSALLEVSLASVETGTVPDHGYTFACTLAAQGLPAYEQVISVSHSEVAACLAGIR